MADGLVQVPADSIGKKVDMSELVVGANTVERQRMILADDAVAAALSKVLNATPAGTEYGLVTRNIPSGTQPVSGTVTSNVGATGGLLLDATFTGRVNTQGQKAMAASTPVVVASDQSAVPVSGTVTANQGAPAVAANRWPVQATDGANLQAVKAASTAALAADPSAVVALSPNTPTPLLSDRTASGNLTAINQAVTISTVGLSSVGVNLAGVWVATLAFEASIDGTNFFAVSAPAVPSGATVQTTTVTGQWMVWVGGFNLFRARVSVFTSGTLVINLEGSLADHQIVVNQPTAANLNTTVTGTVAVSSLAGTVDVSDRAARVLGVSKIVDTAGVNQLAVTAANAAKVDGSAVTQPVSIAAAVDVSDRIARLVGVVRGEQADNAINPTTKVPTLPARANAAAPAWTEGNVAPLSTDLAGNLRTSVITALPAGANVIGTVTANQGTASAQAAAGWPVQPYGMTDSVFAGAVVTAPAANGVIATVTPVAGTYRVDLYANSQAGAASVNDINFQVGGVVQITALGGNLTSAAILYKDIRVTVSGVQALSLNAITGGVGTTYVGQIIATRLF